MPAALLALAPIAIDAGFVAGFILGVRVTIFAYKFIRRSL